MLNTLQDYARCREAMHIYTGDVDTAKRNRLSDESVENIVQIKSWMKFLNVE